MFNTRITFHYDTHHQTQCLFVQQSESAAIRERIPVGYNAHDDKKN
jgi:hypothetical protein